MNENNKPNGIVVNNFVILAFGLLIVVLSVVSGFFASQYFKGGSRVPAQANNGQAAGAGNTAGVTDPSEIFKLTPEFSENEHIYGDKSAKVILVEYSDLQCPFCATFHTTAKNFVDKNPGTAWVYRHLPLGAIHPLAEERAVYSECVAEELGNEAFWKFIDGMFASPDLQTAKSEEVALAAGLDVNKVKDCVSQNRTLDKVTKQRDEGADFLTALTPQQGYGTPGNVLINLETKKGAKLRGAVPLSELEAEYAKIK